MNTSSDNYNPKEDTARKIADGLHHIGDAIANGSPKPVKENLLSVSTVVGTVSAVFEAISIGLGFPGLGSAIVGFFAILWRDKTGRV